MAICGVGFGSWTSVCRFPFENFGGQNPRKGLPNPWVVKLPAACRLPPAMATKKLPTPARAKVTRHEQDRLTLMPSTCCHSLIKTRNSLSQSTALDLLSSHKSEKFVCESFDPW